MVNCYDAFITIQRIQKFLDYLIRGILVRLAIIKISGK
jgi:hypothetical protein